MWPENDDNMAINGLRSQSVHSTFLRRSSWPIALAIAGAEPLKEPPHVADGHPGSVGVDFAVAVIGTTIWRCS